MKYIRLCTGDVIVAKEEERLVGDTVNIELPFPCKAQVNGKSFDGSLKHITIPVSMLKSINDVTLVSAEGRVYRAERFNVNNGFIIPCGYDCREWIYHVNNELSRMSKAISDMRKMLIRHNEAIYETSIF